MKDLNVRAKTIKYLNWALTKPNIFAFQLGAGGSHL
jgi:hypothetical protein